LTLLKSDLSHEVYQERIHTAVHRMDAWLETMRGPSGYGGPVTHWWRDSLSFAGAGLDWRYEGIIEGYLLLYTATHNPAWLWKACRAGDDLVAGQLANGRYSNSSFEFNPSSGGMPHEAACDLAMLKLARLLEKLGDPSRYRYVQAALRNLDNYLFKDLWDPRLGYFQNRPLDFQFVPNKVATLAEAIMARVTLTGEDHLLERFVIPTLNKILECQVNGRSSILDGAIHQAWIGDKGTGRFFPFYIARCIPALILGYHLVGDPRYRHSALSAMGFLMRHRQEDGSFPQVIYQDGRVNLYPQWVAGVGDILRAIRIMQSEGIQVQAGRTLDWLLDGQLPTGAICTAAGFGSHLSQRTQARVELRDVLPVCGWVDKAFRYLASELDGEASPGKVGSLKYELECRHQGRNLLYQEDEEVMACWEKSRLVYLWHKGAGWAEIHLL
jgi:hypothetical protein